MGLLDWAVALASVSLGLTLYGALTWWLGEERAAGEAGLPGYAWYPGAAASLPELDGEVESLEALHSPGRTRLVVRVSGGGGDLEAAAWGLLARSGADVVVIERAGAGGDALTREDDQVWVASADGRGWSGAREEAGDGEG